MSLRIIFFGTPKFAISTLEKLIESEYEIIAVVTQPDRQKGRGQKFSNTPVKDLALKNNLLLLQPDALNEPSFITELSRLKPDIGVVAAYGKLIPDNVLSKPNLGMINLHASLLPKYRGASPVHRAVMAGEQFTGITIMRIERKLDSGNILAKSERSIGINETSTEVEQSLSIIGSKLILSVLRDIVAGISIETVQDHSQATYAKRLTKTDGLIDWSSDANAIHNQVRGLYPWPHAYTFINRKRVIVLSTSIDTDKSDASPGTVLSTNQAGLEVAAKNGSVVFLKKLQPENKRAMNAKDFLAGHPIQPGMVIGIP